MKNIWTINRFEIENSRKNKDRRKNRFFFKFEYKNLLNTLFLVYKLTERHT
jgi:hypothetical protein